MTNGASLPVNTLLFLVGDRERQRWGLTWRIWSAGTSFYIKTREPGLAESKISLHGPDPRHPRPGFKFGRDDSVQPGGATSINTGPALPWWFPGKPDVNELTHAIRICVAADTFADGLPNGSDPGTSRSRAFAGLLPRPPAGSSALIDLYISPGPPDFPIRAKLDQLNALHGPIVNTTGQHLSAITRILPNERLGRAHLKEDVPVPKASADAVRGVQAGIDDDGVLWLVERVLSRAWLASAGTAH